jgi:hypothetical protein
MCGADVDARPSNRAEQPAAVVQSTPGFPVLGLLVALVALGSPSGR